MDEPTTLLLEAALARREALLAELSADTDAYRIVHGSADGMDGLTVDRLGPAFLVERHQRSAVAERLVEAIATRCGERAAIFLKERWSTDADALRGGQVRGPVASPELVVRERGLAFGLDLSAGEHVGLFLDARPARELVRELAAEKRVLNLFCYTGGFGVAAAAGGARGTTNVDNKRSALASARRNYEQNLLPVDTRTLLRDDAIRFLNRAARGSGRYDLVVLDPPPRFTRPGGKAFDANRGYGRLVARCLGVVERGGLLLAGSNALGREDDGELERAVVGAATNSRYRYRVEIVERVGPGGDFPLAPERPTARFVLCRVR
jgi:23S rRNA (cytosine1962-C5)-methyltransferase